MRTRLPQALALAGALAACASAPPQPAAGPPQPLVLPATYAGQLPCADCPGIRTTVTLRADSTYLLRRVYRQAEGGRDRASVELGRWRVEEGGRRLVLNGGDAVERFAVLGARTLRLLDQEGREIRSSLSYDLARAPRVDPFPDALRLRGMYTYMADAGLFAECRWGGARVPVAQEGDNAALERAYTEARTAPGAPVLVNVDGHFAERPRMEGGGTELALVVDRFVAAGPRGATCDTPGPGAGPGPAGAPLEGTRWLLSELEGRAPAPTGDRPAPDLTLAAGVMRAQGSTGCNRFTGSYEIGGAALRFGPAATTRMACPAPGVMEQEQRFLEALRLTTAYRIEGDVLTLLAGERVLARFRATR